MEGAQTVDLPVLNGIFEGQLLPGVVEGVKLRGQTGVEGGGHFFLDKDQLLREPLAGGQILFIHRFDLLSSELGGGAAYISLF